MHCDRLRWTADSMSGDEYHIPHRNWVDVGNIYGTWHKGKREVNRVEIDAARRWRGMNTQACRRRAEREMSGRGRGPLDPEAPVKARIHRR
ncbi:hypothetical protein CEXT_732551 [Caerostris extrusa]|uniref:Uncharacterized protein n=1 Tax=Caerostris extrusa TaxID=172846 RepID=A0AAV4QXB0_CAEEX|nr:hypothetical protein CEXT_732551 [Caerostris extrusa]